MSIVPTKLEGHFLPPGPEEEALFFSFLDRFDNGASERIYASTGVSLWGCDSKAVERLI
jgi:hypothetical protein